MLRGESANKGAEDEAGGEGTVSQRSPSKLLVLLIELHGGRIWAESEPGHGSKFCFTVPKCRQGQPAASQQEGLEQGEPVPAGDAHADAITSGIMDL